MPKLKHNTIFPSPEEEAAINACIATDADTYKLTAEELAELKPYRGGRPKAEANITNRLSPDALAAFKSTSKD